MRGTPFFQTFFIVAMFLLAGWPIYRLTRPAVPTSEASETNASPAFNGTVTNAAPLQMEVLCASAPASFEIKYLDQTVLAGHAPQARFSKLWTTSLPPEGLDLVVQARWASSPVTGDSPATSDATPAVNPAARVTVRFADGRQTEKSFWADANGTMDEVFTIPGAAVP